MAVYYPPTMGALPSFRKPLSSATLGKRTASARIPPPPPKLRPSNTGLPGAIAPAPHTLGKRASAPPPPTAGRTLGRKAPPSAPAPAPPGVAVASGDAEWYQGDDRASSGGGGGGGGLVRPVSDEVIDLDDMAPKDGIPKWAAIAGVAACAVVGFVLLHRSGAV